MTTTPLSGAAEIVVGIDHVQLAMPPGCEDRARAFYVGILGMREVPKPTALIARGGCWFESGAARVHLGVEEGHLPARKAHPALLVTNLDTLLCQLDSEGYSYAWGEPLPGMVRVDVSDPFGNRIELIKQQRTPHCP